MKEIKMPISDDNPLPDAGLSNLLNFPKAMNGSGVPGFDMSACMAMQRKNIELITTAYQAIFENLQSFARQQMELMRRNFEQTAGVMGTTMLSPDLQGAMARNEKKPNGDAREATGK